MPTSQQIEAQIESLREAMAGGVLSIEYQGRKVTYRSMAEMRQAMALLKDQLAEANGSTCGTQRRFAVFNRGYHNKAPGC